MSLIAPSVQAFFDDRLARQRNASPHTVAAYKDTLRLVLIFASERVHKAICQLDFADLKADVVGEFLTYLEVERGNAIRTRNARLAAIHSFFNYASRRHPEHADDIQRVLSIPYKAYQRAEVTHLDRSEIVALLASPDRATWHGRRDHALLLVALQTGFRLSELIGTNIADVHLSPSAYIRVLGKGRKTRRTPLTAPAVATLRVWLKERGGSAHEPVFATQQGTRLSHDAVERLVAKHVATAALACPSLECKSVTPHVLRHTTAMQFHESGVDLAGIALFLGHERLQSTDVYLHADLKLKEKALARLTPPSARPGRYRAPDTLLNFLRGR